MNAESEVWDFLPVGRLCEVLRGNSPESGDSAYRAVLVSDSLKSERSRTMVL